MNSKRTLILTMVLLLLAGVTTAWASNPNDDTLNVTALTSGNGFAPTVPGASPTEWFYAECSPAGSSFSDTFPVSFSVSDSNSTPGQGYTIHLNATGGLAGSTSVPGDFSISDNGVAQTQTISITTGPLSADGEVNVQISQPGPSTLNIPHHTIHIHVFVGSSCPGPTCFFTNSEFGFLQDCSGADVTTNSGGTFQIVPNAKGKVVATNPGQFYYNLIWTNPGSTQAVTITFASSNLNPMGANSVHALVFSSSGFTADATAFDMVNQDGTPCGPSGPCTISVPAGQVLWVTWHLEYAGIGGSSSGISNICAGNVTISATGTIKDSNGGTLATCTTTATGFLKK